MSGAILSHRNVEADFRVLEVAVVKVSVRLGEPCQGLTLRGEPEVLAQIQSQVYGHSLYLGPAPDAVFSTEVPVEIELAVPSLESVSCAAGAQVHVAAAQDGPMRLSAASGARLVIEGALSQVWASAESGGTVDLKGLECRNVSAQSASGGRIL